MFDLPGVPPTLIPINLGNNHPSPDPAAMATAQTWRAVLYNSPANPLPTPWQWSAANRVNFICHSQGGTTIRYLIELLTGTNTPDLPQFLGVNRQPWIKTVVTLGTPHKGTTVTDVDIFASTGLDPLIDFITSCSFQSRPERIYDLHLDHWGFCRRPTDTDYQVMRARIAPVVRVWWIGRNNGLYDNSLRGAMDLALFAPLPSPHTYYFTMSFCATNEFPEDETLTAEEVNDFLRLFPGDNIINSGGVLGRIVAFAAPLVARPLQRVGILPSLQAFLGWVTNVASNHLQGLGYNYRIPGPGTQIPRPDMLPAIAFPSYVMGGLNIPTGVNINITSQSFRRNDGIVNTASMDGPDQTLINNGSFAAHFATPGAQGIHGRYWHMGENTTIDHADQIGVFTNATTLAEIKVMYLLFAELGDRLP
ncbi:uncharacterized protein yc1106_09519 [Curvularia clavata]|uniref:Lipase-like C-terminal domain-containing protein n=1 Tax=Curvularia clavata TaxID=95742 RepID=A0A9Q8ZHE5_CURCL|nr:uncharacterized protein yc1106_09519 [Curvularia clavata]